MDPTQRFSSRVEDYIKYRPSYPEKLYRFLRDEMGFSKGSKVADIGSGTGIFCKPLLERKIKVFGIEPNIDMRKAAEKILNQYPEFFSIEARAEETELPDNSIDFITSAQAFHWFSPDNCRKEFRRILKPKGQIALIWNDRDIRTDQFSVEYEELILQYATDYKEINHQNLGKQEFDYFFGHDQWKKRSFINEQWLDLKGLKGRLSSSSYIPSLGEDNYEEMNHEVDTLFKRHQQKNKVCIVYHTMLYFGPLKMI